MEIRENKNVYIIAPLCEKLTARESKRIINKTIDEDRNIAIDLNYTSECSIEFIEELKSLATKKKISVFNIPSELFVLFNVMKLDKYLKIFVSELDFEENSRQIINRNFVII